MLLSFLSVFPTHVGVFLGLDVSQTLETRLPHARGGVSIGSEDAFARGESSPRTWGCFFTVKAIDIFGNVFPTHVGVFLVDKAQLDT